MQNDHYINTPISQESPFADPVDNITELPASIRSGVSRRTSAAVSVLTNGSSIRPDHVTGQPVGLLAAMGTPQAKKAIYRSRKFKILCPIFTIITLIVRINIFHTFPRSSQF